MDVSGILRNKGAFVATIAPDASLLELTHQLERIGVGALVVSGDGTTILGIVSERDVARAISRQGPEALEHPVSAVMVTDVRTCALTDSTDRVMGLMTERHIRHLPVVDGGLLVGIVSIGDVVKFRLDELQSENGALHDYLYSGR